MSVRRSLARACVTGILMVLGACTEPQKGPDAPDGGDSGDGGSSGETAGPPNLIPQEELFACNGAASDAPTRLRRINRWQWTRNVGGAVTRGWTGFSFYDNPLDPMLSTRPTYRRVEGSSEDLGQPGYDAYFGHSMLDVLRALTLR